MAGAAENRKTHREKIDALLKAALGASGTGIIDDGAFYPYKTGDFEQQFPVIVIGSEGSERERPQRGGDIWDTALFFTVWVFVAYAVEGTAWDSQDAEDTLDLIDKGIADVVMDNRSKAQNATVPWDGLYYEGRSDARQDVEIGGIEYRREMHTLRARVLHG